VNQGAVGVILQARMGSIRLPGKVLADLAGLTILARCVERLKASGVGRVVVATTTRPEDDAIESAAGAAGVRVVRGPTEDVLGRYLLAAEAIGARYVIRATADNPLVDPESPGRVLRVLLDEGADHVVESGLPVGAAVEAVRVDALKVAAARSADAYDREHVTPYIRHRPDQFRLAAPGAPADLRRPDLRLTVDTPDDLKYLEMLLAQLATQDALVDLRRVIAVADAGHVRERAA
jgi:spore coat polysaccharide biosynthesis protein SpsF